MPDWFARRCEDGSVHVRLGGCEYLLTHTEFAELADAFFDVHKRVHDYVESDEYADIVIASENKPADLIKLIKKNSETFKRRI